MPHTRTHARTGKRINFDGRSEYQSKLNCCIQKAKAKENGIQKTHNKISWFNIEIRGRRRRQDQRNGAVYVHSTVDLTQSKYITICWNEEAEKERANAVNKNPSEATINMEKALIIICVLQKQESHEFLCVWATVWVRNKGTNRTQKVEIANGHSNRNL